MLAYYIGEVRGRELHTVSSAVVKNGSGCKPSPPDLARSTFLAARHPARTAMNSATFFILVVVASLVTGKPVSETPPSTTPPSADDPTTVGADQPDASTEGPAESPQPPLSSPAAEEVLLVPEEPSLVRVLQELPVEVAEEAEMEAEMAEVVEAEADGEVMLVRPVALPEGHRHARCRLVRATPTRYPPSRRRQGYEYYQRPYYVSYRPFRPRPAYLRPLQEEPPLQIVY